MGKGEPLMLTAEIISLLQPEKPGTFHHACTCASKYELGPWGGKEGPALPNWGSALMAGSDPHQGARLLLS